MKIRDLNKNDYVIVHDLGKSEYSEGMNIVGRVVEIKFNDGDKNEASIDSLGSLYTITNENHFDLWCNYIESKTKHIQFDKEIAEKLKSTLSSGVQRGKVKLIDVDTVEFENGKQMKVINKGKKQPISVFWVNDTTLGFDNGSRVFIPKDYNTKLKSNDVQQRKRRIANKGPEMIQPGERVISLNSNERTQFIEQVVEGFDAVPAYNIGKAIEHILEHDSEQAKESLKRAYENWD